MKSITILISFLLIAPVWATAPNQGEKPALPAYLHGVGIDQNLNAQVPLNAQFTDDTGHTVRLGDYLRHRPAILAMVYYTCPVLCDQTLRGIAHGLRPLSLQPGRDFSVIAISINPKETPRDAAAKKKEILGVYSKNASPDGWHFLTGTEANIHAVADAVGFHYRYDPKNKMFIHAAGIQVLTPEGKAARYFYGVSFEPKDLDLGLVESSHGKIGSPVDAILLYCCRYDPTTGKYDASILNLLKLVGGGFLVLLAGGAAFLFRHDLRRHVKLPAEVHRT